MSEANRDHVAANLGIEPDDFEYAPFVREGGWGKGHRVFGNRVYSVLEQLNDALVA
jgi:type I restriction enzyme, R subunit